MLNSVRPVTYYNVEDIPYFLECYKYSMRGSGFIIEYGNEKLFLTARHNLSNESTHVAYQEFNNKVESMFLIKNIGKSTDLKNDNERLHFRTILTSPIKIETNNVTKESQDIIIGIIDYPSENISNYIKLNSLLCANYNDLTLEINDLLYVVGFPQETNYLTYNEEDNTSSMTLNRLHLIGYCSRMIDIAEFEMIITNNPAPKINLNGISGAPVFKYNEKNNKYSLAGMVISANSKEGTLIRFLSVFHLAKHLMITDLRFPLSSTEIPELKQISDNLTKELVNKMGEENIKSENGYITITVDNGERYSFHHSNMKSFFIIHLLESTRLLSQKNIYIMQNIFSKMESWETLYQFLIKEKKQSRFTENYIKRMDAYIHEIDNYTDITNGLSSEKLIEILK